MVGPVRTWVVIFASRFAVQNVGVNLSAQVLPVHSWSYGTSGKCCLFVLVHAVFGTHRSAAENSTRPTGWLLYTAPSRWPSTA